MFGIPSSTIDGGFMIANNSEVSVAFIQVQKKTYYRDSSVALCVDSQVTSLRTAGKSRNRFRSSSTHAQGKEKDLSRAEDVLLSRLWEALHQLDERPSTHESAFERLRFCHGDLLSAPCLTTSSKTLPIACPASRSIQ